MNKTTSNLLFLAIGAIVGGTIGYISASNKKEIWLNDINNLVTRIKNNGLGETENIPDLESNVSDIQKENAESK